MDSKDCEFLLIVCVCLAIAVAVFSCYNPIPVA